MSADQFSFLPDHPQLHAAYSSIVQLLRRELYSFIRPPTDHHFLGTPHAMYSCIVCLLRRAFFSFIVQLRRYDAHKFIPTHYHDIPINYRRRRIEYVTTHTLGAAIVSIQSICC